MGRSQQRSSCKSVEGINSMETKKDVSAGGGCCSATGPRSSCKSVEGINSMEKLGLEAKTQPARRSSPWTYFFRRQAANEQRTIINVSFSITGNSSITPRSVLAHLEPH